jgi:hypothetical protein
VAEGFESEIDPLLGEELVHDSSERLYVYTRATGGWFIAARLPPDLGVPFDLTHLAITRSAVYWRGWEHTDVVRRGLFGRKKTEREWVRAGCSISVSEIERVTVSRDGFDPSFASWPREQHLALDIRSKSRGQTFYNWANNSVDVVRDVAAIFSRLGVAVEDRAGVLSR